jgi:hypothetical protein
MLLSVASVPTEARASTFGNGQGQNGNNQGQNGNNQGSYTVGGNKQH